MIKVIVLSLKDSPRRAIITERLKKRGITDFEFYDAFDARAMEISDLEKLFDVKRFRDTYGREPARGEIGCTLSHLGIWKRISESDCENWMVLEDDAILMPWFGILFREGNYPSNLTILGHSKLSVWKGFLSNIKRIVIKPNLIASVRKFGYLLGEKSEYHWYGTVGFALPKVSAIKLDKELGTYPFFLADDFLIYSKYVTINHAHPYFVYEDFSGLESTIEHERVMNKKDS
ncbi:glycosyltransferase family 25 protein [Aliivibrio salmonicida]|uniref:Glycosyltransferase n=1 Tax=Aliivibrio salmonicida (strain LFI1238) TaxID=316275 RepID=B6EHE6_ALISL|nr:glycosyltransferase family 25 protein [Aliivibrio salmonicida]AZL83588.1 glycosyltransferase family 25 protein [Aliivibrio salmonicida]CAQ80725.1 putative glycosyltransferase [Aliivibrio salmonicida LFI1238]